MERTSSDGGIALPTTFTYRIEAPATTAHACVYGGGAAVKTIGAPWWTSTNGKATTATFDGTFNTAKAQTATAVKGQRYFWGTEETAPGGAGGMVWTKESMVFHIIWQ